jgi:hypothetical protein
LTTSYSIDALHQKIAQIAGFLVGDELGPRQREIVRSCLTELQGAVAILERERGQGPTRRKHAHAGGKSRRLRG